MVSFLLVSIATEIPNAIPAFNLCVKGEVMELRYHIADCAEK
jgi:hypothetical protein